MKMTDAGGSCEYQQRPLATNLPISNMQFPTDPPRSTICYGDGDVQGTYQQRGWLTRWWRTILFTAEIFAPLLQKIIICDENKTQILFAT